MESWKRDVGGKPRGVFFEKQHLTAFERLHLKVRIGGREEAYKGTQSRSKGWGEAWIQDLGNASGDEGEEVDL